MKAEGIVMTDATPLLAQEQEEYGEEEVNVEVSVKSPVLLMDLRSTSDSGCQQRGVKNDNASTVGATFEVESEEASPAGLF